MLVASRNSNLKIINHSFSRHIQNAYPRTWLSFIPPCSWWSQAGRTSGHRSRLAPCTGRGFGWSATLLDSPKPVDGSPGETCWQTAPSVVRVTARRARLICKFGARACHGMASRKGLCPSFWNAPRTASLRVRSHPVSLFPVNLEAEKRPSVMGS